MELTNSGGMTMDGNIIALIAEGLGIVATFIYKIGRLEGKITLLCQRVNKIEERLNLIENHLLEKDDSTR